MSGVAAPPDFESYVAARRPQLRRTAYLLCGDWDKAEDVVQDTLTRLYVHWKRAARADNNVKSQSARGLARLREALSTSDSADPEVAR